MSKCYECGQAEAGELCPVCGGCTACCSHREILGRLTQERDEAREAAGRLFRGTAHCQSSGLRQALAARYPWLVDGKEKEANR